jgi:hypothetical protein
MLSHLRFHRRGPSNPTSPAADQQSPWESAPFHEHPHTSHDISPRPDSRPQSSNSPLPPTLPPIARVSSADAVSSLNLRDDEADFRSAPVRHGGNAGFIGGVSLQNYRRGGQEPTILESAAAPYPPSLPENQLSRARPAPPPIFTGVSSHGPAPAPAQLGRAVSSFVTPTDLQQQSFGGQTGTRPAGARMASEPVMVARHGQAAEAPRGKKRLPFFKNQVASLLTRSKPVQPVVEPEPLRHRSQVEQPAYDPRIRGTRVHDFSAPRRKIVPSPPVPVNDSTATLVQGDLDPPVIAPTGASPEGIDAGLSATTELPPSEPVSAVSLQPGEAAAEQETRVATDTRRLSLDKALPPQPPQDAPSPGHDDSSNGASSFVTASPAVSRQTSPKLPRSTLSSRTNRTVSVNDASRRTSTMSAVPRHMKSTSSRFSFDMVGAAKQEKLLEERHRQRELEKKTTEFDSEPRDSRFDDFDEDGFDYDAMMEDDGLEERIPGVNADAEDDGYDYDALAEEVGFEEEIPGVNADAGEEEEPSFQEYDPDNDQENFAGFVFQRSNPASTLASPLTPNLLVTPRDANGTAIGFAMTKDTTPDLGPGPSPSFIGESLDLEKWEGSGLGIQEQEAEAEEHQDPQDQPFYESAIFQERGPSQLGNVPTKAPANDDEIYFDDGLADELNFEHDGAYFDESIFDMNDTDQYGRPIPGAFAQAKSAMAAQHQGTKRESDITADADVTAETFENSGISQSTAHTSLSAGLQPMLSVTERESKEMAMEETELQRCSSFNPGVPGQDLAYQAALAEAAQKAAASGKFRRSSSPTPPPAPVTSPLTEASDVQSFAVADDALEDYDPLEDYEEDDGFSRNVMDDYELDDDDIIAEANAEALANDSDGWYGQEFGFYSAPLNPPDQARGHHGSSSATSSSPKPLTLENLYQYANGGYFGPSGGLGRTTSGRVVSREPNLTPITEMSEYSNRNSIMSLGVQSGGAASSAPIQSPGLAQLAMLSDDGDMSLGALLRLRSKTFGGSQASLVSSRDGGASPRSERPPDGSSSPWAPPSAYPGQPGSHTRKNSLFSAFSNSDVGSGAGSPTLTMNNMAPPPLQPSLGPSPLLPPAAPIPAFFSGHPNHIPLQPPVEEEYEVISEPEPPHLLQSLAGSPLWTKQVGQDEQRPMSPTSPRQPGMGHRHKSSADSISYTKDEESGEGRWILERRRTAETGEVEILEREVVEGGRI